MGSFNGIFTQIISFHFLVTTHVNDTIISQEEVPRDKGSIGQQEPDFLQIRYFSPLTRYFQVTPLTEVGKRVS